MNEPIKIKWLAVFRDVAIIWALTLIGGFIAGVAARSAGGAGPPMGALAIANILLGTVGFIISGCLAKTWRFQHLWVVALFVWLTSAVNAFFGAFGFTQWLLSVLLIIPMMLAGGGISFLFVRTPTSDQG